MSRPGEKWSDAQLDVLKAMWLEGESASTIGRAIGRTRNAVLGIVHRSPNLPKRVTTVARSNVQRRIPVPRKVIVPPEKIIPADQLKPADPPIYTRDLEDAHCRYPYDAPAAPDGAGYMYCGGQRSGASRYCDSHNAIVFQHQQPKRDIDYAG